MLVLLNNSTQRSRQSTCTDHSNQSSTLYALWNYLHGRPQAWARGGTCPPLEMLTGENNEHAAVRCKSVN